jgi:hypothetical protein
MPALFLGSTLVSKSVVSDFCIPRRLDNVVRNMRVDSVPLFIYSSWYSTGFTSSLEIFESSLLLL